MAAHHPPFTLSYRNLPQAFYRDCAPTPVENPCWLARNGKLAAQLSINSEWFASDQALQAFGGNVPLPGTFPLSMAYSGHQFGGWNPMLGDGRAHLIGEARGHNGILCDLHLKGSGPTPFSRNGDGRAALGPMLREYIVSEAMAGLGIPTTRSLAVIATGEEVYRRSKEPGGIVTRVAKSHVRVGTFQFAAVHVGPDAVRALADHEINRNFTELPDDQRYLLFLREVIARQASLIAKWMSVGFIHGVMNTDNMQVAGETIDFGPCAFMDQFHPQKVFSSIDEFGRYAWDQQAPIAQWNLTRFAECLLPLLHDDKQSAVEMAQEELAQFMPSFEQHFENLMRAKLGISEPQVDDGALIAKLFTLMMQGKADFTRSFRCLTQVAEGKGLKAFQKLFEDEDIAQTFLSTWHDRVSSPDASLMREHNPVIIARNHRVEEAISAAYAGDLQPFNRLVAALEHPYTDDPQYEDLQVQPRPEEEVHQTFCGT